MSLVIAPTKYLKHKTKSNRSPNTVRRIAFSLTVYLSFLEENHLTVGDVLEMKYDRQHVHFTDFLAYVKSGQHTDGKNITCPANTTCNTYLRDVFGWFQFLELQDQTHGNLKVLESHVVTFTNPIGLRCSMARRAFRGYLKEDEHIGRTIEKSSIEVLLENCTNIRDKVLLLLLAETGFRIGELLGVKLSSDIDIGRRQIKVIFREDNENSARAKNASQRRALISKETCRVLLCYLSMYRDVLMKSGYLFAALSGKNAGKPLRIKAVYAMLERLEKKTGIEATCFIIPDTFSDSIKTLLYDYIIHRGEVLALGSMRSEYWAFNRLCEFFLDKYPNLRDLTQIPQRDMERSLRVWMIKKGYATASIHNRHNQETPELRKSPLIHFLNRLYRFGLRKEENTEMEKDVWEIDKLPFCVRSNPTQSIRRINFQGIFQEKIRSETKTAVSITIRYLALTTILQQIRAMNRLSSFLKESFPDVASSRMLNREIIEQYLIFLNTEETGKKCFRSELSSLRSLLDTIALSLDEPSLKTLFLPGDISERGRISGYRAYTDSEVKTWNDSMKKLPSQVARVMVIHQLLGNRISETLTLKQDCLCIRGGNLKVKVFQVKTQRTIYKPANEMVKKLIEKAIEETNETYGKREYVFVSSRNPDSPMTYETVQYHLMKLILQENLTDEHGKRYGVGTHAFRHTMGRKLTQMHVDDKTIAMLLGHSGISSVNRYRKFGSRALANETKDVRGSKDRILKQVMRGWEENEV